MEVQKPTQEQINGAAHVFGAFVAQIFPPPDIESVISAEKVLAEAGEDGHIALNRTVRNLRGVYPEDATSNVNA